jgi:hypothetical protein
MQCVTASLHVRNGHPDGHRLPFRGIEHLATLDKYAEELARENKTICTVFVASDRLEHTVFADSKKMSRIPYNIKTLEHIKLPGNDSEIEPMLAEMHASGKYKFEDIYIEYLVDLHLLAMADIYIGSHSNFFSIIAGLRAVWFPEAPYNYTAFLDSHVKPPQLVTLDNSKYFWDGWMEGGFIGGVPF